MSAAIECRGLTVRYDGVPAVDGIDLSIEQGAFFGLLGPNGAGKSSTVKVLCTLRKPDAGSVRVAGHDAVAEPNRVRASIGVLFQDPTVDDRLTGRENLALHAAVYGVPRAERPERMDEAAARAGLGDALDRQVRGYSGGMRRRLELARVMMHRPRVLFLDEPTAGLDPQTRRQLWRDLAELRREQGLTVLLTTHYLEEVEDADAIAIVDHGRIIAQGSPDELKADLPADMDDADLEDVFVHLTGAEVRRDSASDRDAVREAVSKRARRG